MKLPAVNEKNWKCKLNEMFIIVCSTYIHVHASILEPKPFNLTKPRPRSVPMPEKVSLSLIYTW